MSPTVLIRQAEVEGGPTLDCLIQGGRVIQLGRGLHADADREIDAGGGALLPGLVDHHLHLFAMAAQLRSVDVSTVLGLDEHLRARAVQTPRHEWIRVVGWDERRHGVADRHRLDRVVPDHPVRLQHRSGALWVLNSLALNRLGIDVGSPPAGAEFDASGPTGRLWRSDDWLRGRASESLPDLAPVGRLLARLGITAVTDATPTMDHAAVVEIATARRNGRLPQAVQLLAEAPGSCGPCLSVGPRKIVVSDHDLPALDELSDQVAATHKVGRAAAVHCVSRESLALTIAAFESVGTLPGDRVEHCALADDTAVAALARLGAVVVTNPGVLTRRAEQYLARHARDEHDDLWRFGSLVEAGIPTAVGSDAPYGDPDPWSGMRTARDRIAGVDRVLGPNERVPTRVTLAAYLTDLALPGVGRRHIACGSPADLVLLDVPLGKALAEPDARHVAVTLIAGEVVYQRDEEDS